VEHFTSSSIVYDDCRRLMMTAESTVELRSLRGLEGDRPRKLRVPLLIMDKAF
jgi:uncharacterized membrane protein affecting hemolysin expression